MPFAAALSEHPVAAHAAGEVIGSILEQVGERPDVALLFATAPHTGTLDDVARAVRSVLRPVVFAGATAASVVGRSQEVEERPALSLWAARFTGDVSVEPAIPVRLQVVAGPEGWAIWGLPDVAVEPGAPSRTLVLLPDPFSFPVAQFLDGLQERSPDLTVIGGLASAGRSAGGNRLVLDGAMHTDGAVGVLFPAGVRATTIVSQGCRPIGDPMIVTKAQGNILLELASEPALTRLLRMVEHLTPAERALAAQGLHLGRVVDERKDRYERGDFLIRNVLGADREAEAIAVGDEVEIGSTVQFQVRDADSADEDLRSLLAGRRADGALLFTCNGRGQHLFGTPDHDAELVDAIAGGATAGMFCAGELGPVGGRTFLHGFTASVLLLEDE
ncbi:MAG: FIST signal transduction protein [Acidimicrobiales bacterium]